MVLSMVVVVGLDLVPLMGVRSNRSIWYVILIVCLVGFMRNFVNE